MQLQLASLDGHEHTQIKAIQWLLPDHRVTVLTRRQFGLSGQLDGFEIMAVFPAAKPHEYGKEPAVAENSFDQALAGAVETLGAGASDLLLVPSAGPYEIIALTGYLERNTDAGFPSVVLRILSDDVLSGLSAETLARLRTLCETGRIGLHTETAELRSRMEEHYHMPKAGPLNLPCTILPGDRDIEADPAVPNPEIRVAVLGRQRSEKGSYRIPGILRHLRTIAAGSDEQIKIRMVYQAAKTKRLRRLLLELRTRMSASINRNVTIEFFDSGLSEQAFRQQVLSADILLLPYNTFRYRYSGSGIIMDGILGLKPIVHSRGMAMQELLSHGNAEAADSDREFAEKIFAVAAGYARYKHATPAASAHLQELLLQSAQTLTDAIVKDGNPIGHAGGK